MPERDIEDLVVRPAQVFRDKQNINLLTGHHVDHIDPAQQTVSGKSSGGERFEFPYDKLLIATGGAAVKPEIAGIDLPEVTVLKSLEDGRKIKKLLDSNNIKKAVIIGMGYIALEMCEALRERSIEVDMVKPRSVFLPWMNQELAAVVMLRDPYGVCTQTELDCKI